MAKESPAELSAREVVERIVHEVNGDAHAWSADYKAALVRNKWSRWLGGKPPEDVAELVTAKLNATYFADDAAHDELSVDAWQEECDERIDDLIEQQEKLCNQIDLAKQSYESATERAKSAKAEKEECHSRLQSVARELKKPFVYALPAPPDRQRSLLVDDGEEWRLVKLADVLADEPALKAVALQKLGDLNLGDFAEESAKWATVEKPKKLTRKQWDDIGEIVQEWHANQGQEGDDGDEADE